MPLLIDQEKMKRALRVVQSVSHGAAAPPGGRRSVSQHVVTVTVRNVRAREEER